MAGSAVLGDTGITRQLTTPPTTEVSNVPKKTESPVIKSQPRAESAPRESEKTDVLTKDTVDGVADALNAVAKALDRKLSFKVDDETGRIMIQVLDGESGEVIRSIPPEDISNMRESMGSLVGLIYNDMS